jgi:hypothetical protein
MRTLVRIFFFVLSLVHIVGCAEGGRITLYTDIPFLSARSHGFVTNGTNIDLEIVVDGETLGKNVFTKGGEEKFLPTLLPPGETFSLSLYYTGSRRRIVAVRGVRTHFEGKVERRVVVGTATHEFYVGSNQNYSDQAWLVDRLQRLSDYN